MSDSAEDAICRDLTPGMRLTIDGAALRHGLLYSTAQKALRKLWRGEMVKRSKEKRIYIYEGKQGRLV